MNNLEYRIAALEAQAEVQALHARYAELCDAGYDAASIAELFVEDAVWESQPGGARLIGRDAIRENFTSGGKNYPWALHVNVPLSIIPGLDGQSARGSWYLVMPCVTSFDAAVTGGWLAGRYDNHFVRREGQWFYSHLKVTFGLFASNNGDWATDRFDMRPTSGVTEVDR